MGRKNTKFAISNRKKVRKKKTIRKVFFSHELRLITNIPWKNFDSKNCGITVFQRYYIMFCGGLRGGGGHRGRSSSSSSQQEVEKKISLELERSASSCSAKKLRRTENGGQN